MANEEARDCGCEGGVTVVSPVPIFTPGGTLRVAFPSTDVEMEFRQRERAEFPDGGAGTPPAERTYQVLTRNPYLARAVDYVFMIGRQAALQAFPASGRERGQLLRAIRRGDVPDSRVVLVGTSPAKGAPRGGLGLPSVKVEVVYSFTIPELVAGLTQRVASVLADPVARKELFDNDVARDVFRQANPTLNLGRFPIDAAKFYRRLAGTSEGVGGLDEERAVNYALLQHPGPYVASSMAVDSAMSLERFESRVTAQADGTRTALLVMTFLGRVTGTPARLATRVDVTGTWPFVDNGTYEGPTLFGMFPWVERS